MRLLLIMFLLVDCGKVSEDHPGADASIDAAIPACDVTKSFGTPAPIQGANTQFDDLWGWLSQDQATIYLTSDRDSPGVHRSIYMGTRATNGTVSGLTMIANIDVSGANNERPTLTADGLVMLFEVDTSTADINISTRNNIAASFSTPSPVAVINSTAVDWNPWISDDGLVIYFASNRSGSMGGSYDLFKAMRSSEASQFATPTAIAELNSVVDDQAPVLSKDGLEIFFQRYNGSVSAIFSATRSDPHDGFGAPKMEAELFSMSTIEFPNWLSPDRCHLIFTSNRTGGSGGEDLWIATRPQ